MKITKSYQDVDLLLSWRIQTSRYILHEIVDDPIRPALDLQSVRNGMRPDTRAKPPRCRDDVRRFIRRPHGCAELD